MELTTEKIPEYMMPYFINGDIEGYKATEIIAANEWMCQSGIKEVLCPSDEDYQVYFSHYPAFGEPCEVVDCECILEY